MMEWDHDQQPPYQNTNNLYVNGNGRMYMKVMTDEQLESLRKQISIYASICEELVEMHKTLTTQQDLAGGRLGGLYSDPLMAPVGLKMNTRQRWTPTPVQLQILEQIFDQGNGAPSKQKIKKITSELSQHGHISETNVYNWFQNRRARSKRKQQVGSSNNNNGESEVETDVDSPKEKKTEPENFNNDNTTTNEAANRVEDVCFHSPEMSSELHFLLDLSIPSAGDEHLDGKMGLADSYNL